MLSAVSKWHSVLVVVVLLASSFSLFAASVSTSMDQSDEAEYDTPLGIIQDNSNDKIQPSLSMKMADQQKGMVKVFVPTTDVAELYELIKDYRYKGLIGGRSGGRGELAIPTLEVPISLVSKIASLDSVLGVYEYPSVISKDRSLYSIEGEYFDSLNGIPDDEPMSLFDAQHHNLEQAWSEGYIGTDVVVAMPDSGVDFGHPDLQGTQARVPALPAQVTNETVVASAADGQDNATLAQRNVIPGTETIYLNWTEMTTGFTIDYINGNLTFSPALPFNSTVTADY
ncbi:MAG: hypothetical protein KAX31_01360, partial [Thermoplasmata archaeon]|nr:hypothetical protein [Thermoplasmata archaeon]